MNAVVIVAILVESKEIILDNYKIIQNNIRSISILDAMDNEFTSKPVFRNHCQDEDGKKMVSVANRDSAIAISSLKTFSCESDTDLIDSFDFQTYFSIDSENRTIDVSSQEKRKIDLMQHQNYDLYPRIVTPQRPCATMVEITLDPLPESQLHPLLLDVGSDDQTNISKNKLGLLFPSTDPGCPTVTTPKYKAMNIDNLMMCNLCETYVYKQLRPSLPLPESFGPILCLLLHMEFSSLIHGKFVKHACEVVNEQWNDDAHGLCSSRSSNGREIQNISGKIVDELVETLGPMIDLPIMFQASAQTYNILADVENNRLSTFFRKEINGSEELDTEFKARDDVAIKSCASNAWTSCESAAGQKRKAQIKDNIDEEKIAVRSRLVEFVPTGLQLAIAYGANYSMNDSDLFKSGQMSLEEFVKNTSVHLRCTDLIEKRKKWNDMMKAWHARGRKS